MIEMNQQITLSLTTLFAAARAAHSLVDQVTM